MKKKLMALCLTLAMTISLVPATALAETADMNCTEEFSVLEETGSSPITVQEVTKLPTPTMTWVEDYSRLEIRNESGEPETLDNLLYTATITNTDTDTVFEVLNDGCANSTDPHKLSLGWYSETEMATGNYEANIYFRSEDESWENSDSTSVDFSYINPGEKYGDITDVVWDNGELSFIPPDDAEEDSTVFIQFAKKEGEEITAYRYSGEAMNDLTRAMERFDTLVNRNGEGDYYYRIRVISDNLTDKYHGDWSAWSDAYTISEQDLEENVPSDTGIWDGTVADSFAGGSGTKGDPYLIENGAQLANIGDDGYYKLTADIYLNDTTDWKEWTAETEPANVWIPLKDGSSFCGTLDGNGYAIYGLYVSRTSAGAGLFYSVNKAVIQNLSIKESAIFGVDRTGAFSGVLLSSTIENCTNSGKVSGVDAQTDHVGGIVGNASKSVMENCINKGEVFNYYRQTGGIAGGAESTEITGCQNDGTVTIEILDSNSPQQAAGIVGETIGGNNGTVISGCVNTGKVTAAAYRVGGIAGQISEGTEIIACGNQGAVKADNYVGGIVGRFFGGTVEFCENTGEITAAEDGDAGGISGGIDGGVIRNCINKGNVTSDGSNCGGIVGILYDTGDGIANCYNLGKITGTTSVGGICGNTTENTKVLNCWNGGIAEASDQYSVPGAATGHDQGCTIVNCYNITGCCGEIFEDSEIVTEITETELKSVDFLKTLNDWVLANQRVETGYAYWETDSDGYPVPTGTVPAYIPVTGNLILNQPENGSATISHTSALTETEITVTLQANEGYAPYQVWFCADEAPDTAVYAEKKGDNTFTFSMPYGNANVYASVLALPENGVWDGTIAESFAGGDGTEKNPYLIANAEQLALVVNDRYNHFRLIADIYLNDTNDWENWTATSGPANVWTPIGYFNCSFDGNGHTIYGLYTDATQSNQGLFVRVQDTGSVKDLTIAKSHVFGTNHVAAIAATNSGKIQNCRNDGNVTAAEEYASGIAAYAFGENVLEDCANYGNVSAVGSAGGIVGYSASMSVRDCINSGEICSAQDTGGILGCVGNDGVSVENCINYGKVFSVNVDPAAINTHVGGIVGAINATVISNCTNYGAVDSSDNAGGIAGRMGEGGLIEDCINHGDVTLTKLSENEESGEDGGGIVGNAYAGSIIRDCINHGDVTGASKIGGICGYQKSAEIIGCTNEGDLSSDLGFVGGITGYLQASGGDAEVELCVNKGAVVAGATEDSYIAGGIIGYMETREGYSAVLRNSYNIGAVSGYECIGGIVAEARAREVGCTTLVENCYSTGAVSGTYTVGGTAALIGTKAEDTTVTVQNCYCLSTASADVHQYGDVGTRTITNVLALTADQMGQKSSFTGFDFNTVWLCVGDGSYPVLRGDGKIGEMGGVISYNYYENGAVVVTADEANTETIYAVLASYEGGKMKSVDIVELSAGEESTLILDSWGQEVKLFAVSADYAPLCSMEEL